MCVIVGKYIDEENRRKAKRLGFEGCGKSDCGCLSETGYHKFEPYETQTELLIGKLDELIKLIKDWNATPRAR